jgi:hypothetical protein
MANHQADFLETPSFHILVNGKVSGDSGLYRLAPSLTLL